MNKVRIIIEFEQTQADGSISKVQHTEEQLVENSSTLEGIDSCEKVVLQTAYAAMRGAVSEQMSAASKKKLKLGRPQQVAPTE